MKVYTGIYRLTPYVNMLDQVGWVGRTMIVFVCLSDINNLLNIPPCRGLQLTPSQQQQKPLG